MAPILLITRIEKDRNSSFYGEPIVDHGINLGTGQRMYLRQLPLYSRTYQHGLDVGAYVLNSNY